MILASRSPRRKEILSALGLDFQLLYPEFDESSVPFDSKKPFDYVCELASQKAFSIHGKAQEIIISADTIVFCNEKIFGKPKDLDDAFSILEELCGKWHSVFTGVCVRKGEKAFSEYEKTEVFLNPLNAEQIKQFHRKINCLDKAGAYAIQGPGSLICQKIVGCYYNVMGLPVNTLATLLAKLGIDLWSC